MHVDDELRAIFLAEVNGYLEVLRDPAAALDAQAAAAHGLKGSAGMLGFAELQSLAAELEHSLRRGDPGPRDRHLPRLGELVAELEAGGEAPAAAALSASTNASTSTSTSTDDFDPETAALLRSYFVEEAEGHLATVEDRLAELATAVEQRPIVDALFRATHTLKGAAGTVGLPAISEAAHALEDVFDGMRRAGDRADPGLVSHLAGASELLRAMLESVEDAGALGALRDRIRAHLAGSPVAAAPAPTPPSDLEPGPEWDEETRQILLETFGAEAAELLDRLEAGIERLVLQPEAQADTLNELFRAAHTLKGSAAAVGCREISQAAHLLEDRFDTRRGPEPRVDPTLAMIWSETVSALRALVAARAPADVTAALGRVHALLETGLAPAASSAPAPRAATLATVAPLEVSVERRAEDERRAAGRRIEDDRLIRVDAERLDLLLRAGGEVVFRRTFIERRAEEIAGLVKDLGRSYQGLRTAIGDLRNQPGMEAQTQRLSELQVEFADEVANFERAVSSLREETEGLRRDVQYLQDGTTKLRTMSVRYLFTRLRRAVRDIAREEGKQVALEVEGESTEIDRVVAEKLAEPMIHVIRNAVAHGIEAPTARRAAGKAEAGRVTLSAREEGTFVIIEVADDGRGLDVPAIREALVARGLMSVEDAGAAPEEEVTAAIFLPGLSTRRAADAVAGRGVGLDVVRDSVLKLGGEVTVRSEPGRGARFTLRLPLSTAITNALLFKVGGEVLCIPVRWVVETRYLRPEDVAEERGREVAAVRGRRISLLRLPRVLDVDSRLIGPYLPVVVVRHEGVEFAVQVDKLVGPREIVVRELGPVLAPLALYDAATISGAGKVQFVVNVATLHQLVALQRGSRLHGRPEVADAVRRVLVVDDSRSIREVVSRMLVAEGYGVDLAVDGWDAWERMSATRVDLLLTDLEMPRMDGYALIDKVRRSSEYAALPILVLSSRTGEENQVRARRLGANGFLAKPVNRRVILARLRELLRG